MRRSAAVQPVVGGSARMPPLPLRRAFAGGRPSTSVSDGDRSRIDRRHSGASSASSAHEAAREAVVSWGQNTWRSIGSLRRNSNTTVGTSVSRQASPRWSEASRSPRRPPRHPRRRSDGAGSGASGTPGHSRASTPSVVWPVDSPQASYGKLPLAGKQPPSNQVVLGTTVVRDAYYSPGNPTLGGPNSVPKGAPTITAGAAVDVGSSHPHTGCAKYFSCFEQPSYQNLLSGDDYRRFRDLTTWLSHSYDDSNEHHSGKLRVLFDAAFHGKPYSSVTSDHWRRLGFQGDDPRRDFRGGGIAALDVMVYIAHHHFDVFKRIMNEGADYGFALAVINLVYVVKRHLRLVYLTDADLRAMKLPPCGARVMRNFAYAFASYAFFFHEVVCACLEVVHAQWMQLKASDNTLTLLQFNAGVLDDVPRALNKAFRGPP